MNYSFRDKKIGVWGYGVVGKSVSNYMLLQNARVSVLDKRPFSPQEQDFFKSHAISYYNQDDLISFLEQNDWIVPSPGIDIAQFPAFQHKFLAELDIFASAWNKKKPIIAVTGTIGKTTVTHLVAEILATQNFKIAAGGNIGLAMLDLLPDQDKYDLIVLELSSYQLEQAKHFSADYALWTNLYPNHLDRHQNLEAYRKAKFNLIALQKPNQEAIINLELIEELSQEKIVERRPIIYFCPTEPRPEDKAKLKKNDTLFFIDKNNKIVEYKAENNKTIIDTSCLPSFSFPANWLIITALLKQLNLPPKLLCDLQLSLPEHRGELVDTINNVSFYNDSKSTIFESTLAAVDRLQGKPIILMLGGQSKGVDRTKLVKQLKDKTIYCACFGQEAHALTHALRALEIPAKSHKTLEEAFNDAVKHAEPHSQILFSPGGASYDLFKDYKERGKLFVALVEQLKNIKNG